MFNGIILWLNSNVYGQFITVILSVSGLNNMYFSKTIQIKMYYNTENL